MFELMWGRCRHTVRTCIRAHTHTHTRIHHKNTKSSEASWPEDVSAEQTTFRACCQQARMQLGQHLPKQLSGAKWKMQLHASIALVLLCRPFRTTGGHRHAHYSYRCAWPVGAGSHRPESATDPAAQPAHVCESRGGSSSNATEE